MKTGKIPGVSRPVPRLILDCADAPALADALRAGVGAVLLPADLPLPDAPEPGPVVLRRGGEHPLPADVTLWREDPPARGVYGGEDWSVPQLLEITERAVDSGAAEPAAILIQYGLLEPVHASGLASLSGWPRVEDRKFYSGCFLPVLCKLPFGQAGPAFDSAYNRQRAERAERMAQFKGAPVEAVYAAFLMGQSLNTFVVADTLAGYQRAVAGLELPLAGDELFHLDLGEQVVG